MGKHLLRELLQQGYEEKVVARSQEKAAALSPAPYGTFIAEAIQPEQLNGFCEGTDVILSALGKSISPNDRSKSSSHYINLVPL